MNDPTVYSYGGSLLKEIFASIDKTIYSLINFLYQIFFNVANASLISGETIKAFFSRIQLILGIIVLFKIAISLINGIINPDKLTDNKSGFSKIITRVITALVLLVLIVPLNIPQDAITNGSYESQLNNNGILFGTLYEFQNRILSQNTIAKLILGTDATSNDADSINSLEESGNQLSSVILKSFVTVNMLPDKLDGDPSDANNRVCGEQNNDVVNNYLDSKVNLYTILNSVTTHCSNGYVFVYQSPVSTVVGIIFIIIMLGFTLDIAIRAIKLSILRLIAPVPIISYIDPKSENGGAFGSWAKSVSSTYIDLFIRLAVVYFILFIIDEFTTNGIVLYVQTGMVGVMSKVFIYLGLFFFAKEAPKFITESLGIKSNGNMFSGIGKMLGVGAVAGSVGANAITGYRAAKNAYEVNHKGNTKLHNVGGFGHGIAGAIGGSTAGTLNGGSAILKSKDHFAANASKAMRTRNNELLANAAAGGTSFGRARNSLTSTLFGDTDYDRLKRDESVSKRQLESAKSKQAVAKSAMDYFKAQAAKTGKNAVATQKLDATGNRKISMALDDWNANVEKAKATGSNYVNARINDNGNISMQQIDLADAIKYQSSMEESAAGYYAKKELDKGTTDMDPGVAQRIDNMNLAGIKYETASGDDLYSSIKDEFNGGFSDINQAQNALDKAQDGLVRASANSRNAKK